MRKMARRVGVREAHLISRGWIFKDFAATASLRHIVLAAVQNEGEKSMHSRLGFGMRIRREGGGNCFLIQQQQIDPLSQN
jgi:hypothetical protein